jgi:methylmalonyl-CoA/ethylmalonyl-CoA epimerase
MVADIVVARDRLVTEGRGAWRRKTEPGRGKPVLFLHPKDFCGTLIELEQA